MVHKVQFLIYLFLAALIVDIKCEDPAAETTKAEGGEATPGGAAATTAKPEGETIKGKETDATAAPGPEEPVEPQSSDRPSVITTMSSLIAPPDKPDDETTTEEDDDRPTENPGDVDDPSHGANEDPEIEEKSEKNTETTTGGEDEPGGDFSPTEGATESGGGDDSTGGEPEAPSGENTTEEAAEAPKEPPRSSSTMCRIDANTKTVYVTTLLLYLVKRVHECLSLITIH
ncbi:hypothetical protein ILUMI_23971 [Ignelater luminosus]|uniref:Uncharacterized protein n=1 Tax=Ignelater luminosus TaxID=2038154 RepID=A0A8K0C7X8_IGNLU|nr:hypothetical protein ILUMI_23971 [Ignelater luminosus]